MTILLFSINAYSITITILPFESADDAAYFYVVAEKLRLRIVAAEFQNDVALSG